MKSASLRPIPVLLVSLAACSSPAAPVRPTPAGITLALSGATVRDTAAAFATQTGEPLVVTPDAERYADCVRLTLLVPAPRPIAEVAALLETPLHAEGFSLARGAMGWTLAHEGEAPRSCATALAVGSVMDGPATVGTPPPPSGPVTETHAEIARADFDAWLASSDQMTGSARVIPYEEGGSLVGFRVFGIRRESMPARLGFQNGDTIYSVNGTPVATPDQVLEAYASLREASEFRVDMSRRGERLLHVIRVIEPPE